MGKRWLLVTLVIASDGAALADEASDRRDLISKIDGKLDYAASELSGLENWYAKANRRNTTARPGSVEELGEKLEPIEPDVSDDGD
jgi:hypothetical protein